MKGNYSAITRLLPAAFRNSYLGFIFTNPILQTLFTITSVLSIVIPYGKNTAWWRGHEGQVKGAVEAGVSKSGAMLLSVLGLVKARFIQSQ